MSAYAEVRLPRASFTSKLETICAKLDAKSCAEVFFRDLFFNRPTKNKVAVKALWVVGSYARGAQTCGDLDLVAEFDYETGAWPLGAALNKTFFGALPRVRLYPGTPTRNDSGVEFEEARLIWQAGSDWNTLIQAIPVVEDAVRFERPDDSLPVSREHLKLPVERALELVEAQKAGRLKLRFVALDDLLATRGTLDTALQDDLARLPSYAPKTVQRQLPGLAGYLRTVSNPFLTSSGLKHVDDSRYAYRGHYLQVGGKGVPFELLDSFEYHQLAIFLPFGSRWTNGVLIVERGPAHPLVTAFEQAAAWALHYPEEAAYSGSLYGKGAGARILDLFTCKEGAQSLCALFADAAQNEEDEPWPRAEPELVKGEALLRLVSHVDILQGATEVPVTLRGAYQLSDSAGYHEFSVGKALAALQTAGYLPS